MPLVINTFKLPGKIAIRMESLESLESWKAGKPGKLESHWKARKPESWKAGKPGKPESKKKRKLEKSLERLRTTLPPGWYTLVEQT